MPNQLLTISKITRRALPVLANMLTAGDKFNRQYDSEFGEKGYKIGGTANIRLPVRYLGTFGPALNVEAATENFRPISIRYQFHVDVQFSMSNRLLDIDDFEDRFIKPAMETIANRVDSDACFYFYQNVANSQGTPGTFASALDPFNFSRAMLVSEGMPKGQTPCAVLHPFIQASVGNALRSVFNPQVRISDVYETGLVAGKTAGADWFEDANVAGYTTGSLPGTPVLAGITTATAGSGLVTSGWQPSGFFQLTGLTATTAACIVGDTIQVAGLYPANPQNRRRYGNTLKTFVVLPPGGYAVMSGAAAPGGPAFSTATLANGTFNNTTGQYTSDGGGILSVLVGEPAIIGGQFQNTATSSAFTGTPAVTINGGVASGTQTIENIYSHRDALGIVVVDLPIPTSAVEASRASHKDLGLSIRILTQYTVNNDSEPTRMDIAYGVDPLYPSLGVRVRS